MAKINVLEKHVAELIAAGEVVERPSSVIKELVENSVDAGASVITIEVCHGGISFMRVTDNGQGIEKDDVPKSFLRHATSKVLTKEDLTSIATLGFRGEALASICAVSHMEIITRTADTNEGTRAVCNGGDIASIEPAGCPTGTTIIVRDLFYNIPARMKFLKKDVAEGNAVARIIDKITMSHPEISFRFIRDGKEVLHSPGDNKLKSAVYAVYGKDFTTGLIPVNYELGGIKVWGFISSPHYAKPNRNTQNFFINGRFVRSKTAIAALEEAYKNSILVGKFPACVLHMEMNCSTVDVNVHPTKLEVRFTNEKPVFDAVYYAAKSALSSGDTPKVMNIKPNSFAPYAAKEKAEQTKIPQNYYSPVNTVKTQETVNKTSLNGAEKKPLYSGGNGSSADYAARFRSILEDENLIPESKTETVNRTPVNEKNDEVSLFDIVDKPESKPITRVETERTAEKKEQFSSSVSEVTVSDNEKTEQQTVLPPVIKEKSQDTFTQKRKESIEARFVGEVFNTYIILQYGDDKMMLIDKHAAHERILYEKLKKSSDGKNAQTFLEPRAVVLEMDDYTSVINHLDDFFELGFEIDDFGDGTVLVRSAPMLLDGQDAADAVTEIAGYLTQNKSQMSTEYMDWLYHNIACRAAVKGGNKMSDAELIEIAKMLEENPEIKYCPHGRPVSMIIKKRDLEKEFGRLG